MLKMLPLGINTFRDLVKRNCLYIDKTMYAYDLITGGFRYFLSRPRRFGKSLFVSTLKEILLGEKDLFKGLWIHSSDYHWEKHAVLTFEFSALNRETPENFVSDLRNIIHAFAGQEDIIIPAYCLTQEAMLSYLVEQLHKKYHRVAILIDEYDSPITRHIAGSSEKAYAMRTVLQNFFACIKGLDQYIDFVFITGVSAFAKAGLFSGMNNLQILTLNDKYSGICGYTDEEIDFYFKEYIQDWSHKKNIPFDEIRREMRHWYNGYRFGKEVSLVYNPFSIINVLTIYDFQNFWVQSGLPSFLVEELSQEYRKKHYLIDPETFEGTSDLLGSFDIGKTPLTALFFQTGYLTIAGYTVRGGVTHYQLKYPNFEVQHAFKSYLLSVFIRLNLENTSETTSRLYRAFADGTIEQAVVLLSQLFSHIPYQLHISHEHFYHALLQMIFSVAGFNAQSEYSTSHGRIDLVLTFVDVIYVIEIKFNKTPEEALEQIKERKYYERFIDQARDKKIILNASLEIVNCGK